MSKIKVLNDRLINKIAAGEVVERPAAALKELLENSLDAGAGALRIDLEDGGKRLIRVIDDGEGMDRDDALLAFERHATSKIRDIADLESIGSLGFRGEALPSIAAVGRLVLRTRRRGDSEGTEIALEGGVIKDVRPTALAPGTIIEVRDLFFNIPARRKFLRTTPTEFGHCQGVAVNYALAFPEVSFALRHNGGEVFNAPPAESLRDRITQLLGARLLEQLLAIARHGGAMQLTGFVGDPKLNRPDTSMLHFFVNRRFVRDNLLIRALRTAYEDLLPRGRVPVAFIFIDLPAKAVDVNVHPAKIQIKFRDPRAVHDFVAGAVRAALTESKPLDPLAGSRAPVPPPAARKASSTSARSTLESFDRALRKPGRPEKALKIDFRECHGIKPLGESPRFVAAPSGTAPDGAQPAGEAEEPPAAGAGEQAQRFLGSEIDPDTVAPLGQIGNSFIVARFPGGLLLIDQHAAHERVLFEKFSEALQGDAPSQQLLHPLILDLPPALAGTLESFSQELRSLGFDLEPFGPGSIALRALPHYIEPEDAEELVANMASDLEKIGSSDADKIRRAMVVSAACHGAIKVNTPLDRNKMRCLIDDLFRCEMPMRCPHGRPVVLTFGLDELRRRFGRS